MPEIMHPDYRLVIAGAVLDGRDDGYRSAAINELAEFPGLTVTAHDVVLAPEAIILHYTEHGASTRYEGNAAAWSGITIFRVQDGKIREGWSESDYYARKRQLKTGACDTVPAPHPAPWDTPCLPASPETEAVVRGWLRDPEAVLCHDEGREIFVGGRGMRSIIKPEATTLSCIYTSGNRAAFHLICTGRYMGGFEEVDDVMRDTCVSTGIAAIATVGDGKIASLSYATDRLGLARRLMDAQTAR
jgi:predicted ester cyclase